MASLTQALLPILPAGQEVWRCSQPPILPLQQHLGPAQRPQVLPPALQTAGCVAQSYTCELQETQCCLTAEGRSLHPEPLPCHTCNRLKARKMTTVSADGFFVNCCRLDACRIPPSDQNPCQSGRQQAPSSRKQCLTSYPLQHGWCFEPPPFTHLKKKFWQ